MDAERYNKKRVKIILKNGFHYSGIVLEVSKDTLIIKDKFDNQVSIDTEEIMLIEEVGK